VAQVGFPVDIQTHAQQIGQAGHGEIKDPNNPCECHHVVSPKGFNCKSLQICEIADTQVKNKKCLPFKKLMRSW
jgi:hypothetical protein